MPRATTQCCADRLRIRSIALFRLLTCESLPAPPVPRANSRQMAQGARLPKACSPARIRWKSEAGASLLRPSRFNSDFGDTANAGTALGENPIRGNYRAQKVFPSGTRNATGWFNTVAFAAPAAYTFGNAGRSSVYGPGMQSLDLAAVRAFHGTERVGFEPRGEFLIPSTASISIRPIASSTLLALERLPGL
jgi:hypothetical protein